MDLEKEVIKIADLSLVDFIFEDNPEACCIHAHAFSSASGRCGKCRKKSTIKDNILALCEKVRADALEEAAKHEDERVAHFQSCMEHCKSTTDYSNYNSKQNALWEYQAMRDEHIQSAKALRALKQKREGL